MGITLLTSVDATEDMSSTQPEWSPEHNRYLSRQWHPQKRSYYFSHYVDGRWVFFAWVPDQAQPLQVQPLQVQPLQAQPVQTQPVRADSPHGVRESTNVQRPGEGPTIVGTYDYTQATPNSHVERLDSTYFVRPSSFFQPGKVFSVLFSEAAGSTATPYNDSFSLIKFGEYVHSQIRRFIVISQRRGDGFCYAIPIFTYGGQGTMKPGLNPNAHAIAYSEGYSPSLLRGETQLQKQPICIKMALGVDPLTSASRIFFGIHHPIQHNVKVKDVGEVHSDDMTELLAYWNMHNPLANC